MRKYGYVKPYGWEVHNMKHVTALFINLWIIMLLLFAIPTILAAQAAPVDAQDSPESVKEQGIDLFMENQPEAAAPLLQTALRKEPQNGRLYMYLAVCYEQLGDFEAALQIYQDGLPHAGSDKATFYYNMGVNYQRLEQYDQAEEMYQEALKLNNNLAGAYLNRANLYVRQAQFDDAVSDYRVYLSLQPSSAQRKNIEQMIALLSQKVVQAERERLEQERLRREEEQRRQALLDQVLNSLEESGEETKGLSEGTGEVKDTEQGFDIVD